VVENVRMKSRVQSAKNLLIGELLKVEVSVSLAEQAYSARQTDALAHIGRQLSSSLVGINEWVGRFYEGLALSSSLANRARADAIFAQVAERATPLYRAKALLASGSLRQRTGDDKSALALYQDAERLAPSDPLIRLYTGENRAIIESARGNHKRALAGFVAASRYATGANYFNNLNSIAEELKELGRYEEAHHYSSVCMRSPFAAAYPEWRDTAVEILSPSRSLVSVSRMPDNAKVTTAPRLSLMRFNHRDWLEVEKLGELRLRLAAAAADSDIRDIDDMNGLVELFGYYERMNKEQRKAIVEQGRQMVEATGAREPCE
jgi:tetratricopeptide (TPR) repeat protein